METQDAREARCSARCVAWCGTWCCFRCGDEVLCLQWSMYTAHFAVIALAMTVCFILGSALVGLVVVVAWSVTLEVIHRYGYAWECSTLLDSNVLTRAPRRNDENMCTQCCKVPMSSRWVSTCTPVWRRHNLIFVLVVLGGMILAFLGWLCFCYQWQWGRLCDDGPSTTFTTFESLGSRGFARLVFFYWMWAFFMLLVLSCLGGTILAISLLGHCICWLGHWLSERCSYQPF